MTHHRRIMESFVGQGGNSTFQAYGPDARCPACRRFIGPLDTCPYCDCPSGKPLTLRLLRKIAILLAVAGMGMIYAMSAADGIPSIRLSDISSSCNSARVRVTGVLEGKINTREKRGETVFVSFRITDGAVGITAAAYGDCAAGISRNKPGPGGGGKVTVIGRLSVKAGKQPRLVIESPEDLIME